jgi:hypothetical protein
MAAPLPEGMKAKKRHYMSLLRVFEAVLRAASADLIAVLVVNRFRHHGLRRGLGIGPAAGAERGKGDQNGSHLQFHHVSIPSFQVVVM